MQGDKDVVNPLEDPFELGRRLAACRGYAGLARPALGDLMGVDGYRVGRWEGGHDLGTLEQRQALAERIADVTSAPRFFVGLADAPAVDLERRVEALETQMAETQAPGS